MSGLTDLEVTERFQEYAVLADGKPSKVRGATSLFFSLFAMVCDRFGIEIP